MDVLVTLNAEWRKLLPFIDPEVKDGLQALCYYCLEANEAAEPVVQNPAPMVPQGQANNRPMNGAGVPSTRGSGMDWTYCFSRTESLSESH